jgi:NADPH-dependent 2,4-dienoyl-CoA reductase/sulfur reductase-like enzyme
MGVGGLDAMVRGGLPIAGKRVVVAGTGPLLLAVAAHLARRGAQIVALCDQAPLGRGVLFAAHLLGEPAKLLQGVRYGLATLGARFYTGCWPVAASGTDCIEAVTLQRNGRQWDVQCDYLACGFHLVPNLELPALLGCRVEDGFVAIGQLQQTSVPDVYCAGEPAGIGGVELALLQGQIAGLAAAGKAAEAGHLARRKTRRHGFVRALRNATVLDPRLKKLASDETLICRCEDVSFAALRLHGNWRDAKLHTRCGMGPCQGRICGPATEFLFGWSPASDQSNPRPPIFPALVASLGIQGERSCGNESPPPSCASPVSEKETP